MLDQLIFKASINRFLNYDEHRKLLTATGEKEEIRDDPPLFERFVKSRSHRTCPAFKIMKIVIGGVWGRVSTSSKPPASADAETGGSVRVHIHMYRQV